MQTIPVDEVLRWVLVQDCIVAVFSLVLLSIVAWFAYCICKGRNDNDEAGALMDLLPLGVIALAFAVILACAVAGAIRVFVAPTLAYRANAPQSST